MHRSAYLAAHALLIAVSCGGAADGAYGVGLRFADAEALRQTDTIIVSYYVSDGRDDQCSRLRAARPRLRADLGPFRQLLDDTARNNGTTLERSDIPVGVWAVLVDATTADGTQVGEGCAQAQVVTEGKKTSIAIVIDAP